MTLSANKELHVVDKGRQTSRLLCNRYMRLGNARENVTWAGQWWLHPVCTNLRCGLPDHPRFSSSDVQRSERCERLNIPRNIRVVAWVIVHSTLIRYL